MRRRGVRRCQLQGLEADAGAVPVNQARINLPVMAAVRHRPNLIPASPTALHGLWLSAGVIVLTSFLKAGRCFAYAEYL